jgi:hypothetical protein
MKLLIKLRYVTNDADCICREGVRHSVNMHEMYHVSLPKH